MASSGRRGELVPKARVDTDVSVTQHKENTGFSNNYSLKEEHGQKSGRQTPLGLRESVKGDDRRAAVGRLAADASGPQLEDEKGFFCNVALKASDHQKSRVARVSCLSSPRGDGQSCMNVRNNGGE